MPEAVFNKERHIKYFLRCLKTFLPDLYTSNDSNRMLLAFFTVSGLDLLGVLESKTTAEERESYINWIYHCQLPTGGFRGFTGTDFGLEKRTSENAAWDPANVPSTFFALLLLVILGDDLSRVKRLECLQWLPKMQRENGSFGEVLGPNDQIEGGGDLRFCCFGAGTRYILRGKCGKGVQDVQDIDVDRLMSFIEACQAFDGGIGESPFCESHSGHTYCAIGALSFLDRLSKDPQAVPLLSPGRGEFESLVRWLIERQTSELGEDESDDEDGNRDHPEKVKHAPSHVENWDERIDRLAALSPPSPDSLRWAGFNGRSNKYADTCYSFWNVATLAMMDKASLIDSARNRQYLLEKTQHIVGGFGKSVGEPPDLLHSYFGLVALAFGDEQGLDRVDPALCATHRAVQRLHSHPWWQED